MAPAALNAAGEGSEVDAIAADSFDAAGLEKILGEGRARRELRLRAERGEKNLRPRAGRRQQAVRGVAQRLKRLR